MIKRLDLTGRHYHKYGAFECECGAPTPQWLIAKRRDKRLLAIQRKLGRADGHGIDPANMRPDYQFCEHGYVKRACIRGCNPALITRTEDVPF
jgi:hypothetical protein